LQLVLDVNLPEAILCTRAQALEWASYNVQVNAIASGIFPDPVTAEEAGARRTAERAAQMVPWGDLENSRK
jgi:NAD(P)-dependent dehydrogenase (short-subunit alcohol dehydrogenase family)